MKLQRLTRSLLLLTCLSAPAAFAQQPAPTLEGSWSGVLQTPGGPRHITFHLHQDAGTWACTVDSPDQGAMGIACDLTSAANPVTIEIAIVSGKWTGTIAGNTLTGTYTQGAMKDVAFNLTRDGAAPAVPATASAALDGTWSGMLITAGPTLKLVLHLHMNAGEWTCTLDSVDQGAKDVPCNVTSAANPVAIDVPLAHGSWTGTLSGDLLTGTWTQGAMGSLPLTFTRGGAATPPAPPATTSTTPLPPGPASTYVSKSPAAGVFLGTLDVGGGHTLRLQFHLTAADGGGFTCSIDSLDQHAAGIPCTVKVDGNNIGITVSAVGASFDGKLSADAKTITGTFTQGGALPLTLTREATPIATSATDAPPAMEAALPAATASDIQSILDKDLAVTLASGALSPATHGGVTIGILSHGVRKIFSYGTAKPDSIFEIGSITKTFTATILAQMVEQQSVRLDEPVRDLLPPGTVAKPATGKEITLLDLSDQHSGLPRMPTNFNPTDPANPYADYTPALLYAFVAHHGVARDPAAPFGYSNLGVGLLGQALSERAKLPYSQLLQQQVTGPLGMTETAITLTPSMKARFLQGYGSDHTPAHSWELDALNGAGGIRSTAADMLTYLEAQLRPNHISQTNSAFPDAATLGAAIVDTHMIRADVGGGMHIALNWFHFDKPGAGYWHNGATGGYSTYARFSPENDYAIIVLFNTTAGDNGSFADLLGAHIAQRLEGLPAQSLSAKS